MNAAARLVEVRVPDMGNFKDVAVIDILVKPGESIQPEAPLVTLETRKSFVERAIRERALIVCTHQSFPGVGRLVERDGKRTFVPE